MTGTLAGKTRMPTQSQSPFVPHDLKQPLSGRGEGPLSGLSVVVKDMYDIAGERTGGGSPAWLAAQKPAERHSAVVQAVLDAGATITGKTICDEFFYSVSGINAHYGTPLNARAPDRIPGGSSSGSVAACAAGCCDIAIGSDTGGSVRVPAVYWMAPRGRGPYVAGRSAGSLHRHSGLMSGMLLMVATTEITWRICHVSKLLPSQRRELR